MERLDTADVPEADRFAYWREVLTARFLPLSPERRDGDRFAGALEMGAIGDLPLTRVTAGGHVVRRSGRLDELPDVVFLTMQRGPEFRFEQRTRSRVGPGDLFVIDSREAFELDCARRADQLCLTIPRDRIDARLHRPECAAGTVLRGAEPATALLADYLRAAERVAAALDDDPDGTPGEPAAIVADHVVELFAHVLNRRHVDAPLPRDAFRAGLYASACAAIERDLARPGLGSAQVARRLRVSTRLLQRVFAERGDGVARRIRRRRIERAAELLADPRNGHRSVTEIALAVGFVDLAHFSRVFAAQTGLSPTAWRRAGGTDDGSAASR